MDTAKSTILDLTNRYGPDSLEKFWHTFPASERIEDMYTGTTWRSGSGRSFRPILRAHSSLKHKCRSGRKSGKTNTGNGQLRRYRRLA